MNRWKGIRSLGLFCFDEVELVGCFECWSWMDFGRGDDDGFFAVGWEY